jgi:hypothetical protein
MMLTILGGAPVIVAYECGTPAVRFAAALSDYTLRDPGLSSRST